MHFRTVQMVITFLMSSKGPSQGNCCCKHVVSAPSEERAHLSPSGAPSWPQTAQIVSSWPAVAVRTPPPRRRTPLWSPDCLAMKTCYNGQKQHTHVYLVMDQKEAKLQLPKRWEQPAAELQYYSTNVIVSLPGKWISKKIKASCKAALLPVPSSKLTAL